MSLSLGVWHCEGELRLQNWQNLDSMCRWIHATSTTSQRSIAFCRIGKHGASAMSREHLRHGDRLDTAQTKTRGSRGVLVGDTLSHRWITLRCGAGQQVKRRQVVQWPDAVHVAEFGVDSISWLAFWRWQHTNITCSLRRYPSKGGYGCTAALQESEFYACKPFQTELALVCLVL